MAADPGTINSHPRHGDGQTAESVVEVVSRASSSVGGGNTLVSRPLWSR